MPATHVLCLGEPSAAPSSGYPVGYPTCLESRYQAFIASSNRITLACLEFDLVLTVYATTIIIAFGVTAVKTGSRRVTNLVQIVQSLVVLGDLLLWALCCASEAASTDGRGKGSHASHASRTT